MKASNFDSGQCARVRRRLDEYLSREPLGEAAGEVERHLASCAVCSEELASRTRVRSALQRASASLAPPEELRQRIKLRVSETPVNRLAGPEPLAWAVGLAAVVAVILAGVGAERWVRARRSKEMVNNILALGISDHIICAIKGHNYPEAANPPAELRRKLGPQYSGLLDVVQHKLPGFEVLEAHLCSLPGSPRQYVHFITRGRGTILSVILTRRDGEHLPTGNAFVRSASGGVSLFEAHLEGMNAVGFESTDYFGFVVSDLSPNVILRIASELAPPLKAALDLTS